MMNETYQPEGKKKLSIWVPEDLVERMDQMEVSRPALITMAIRKYLKDMT